MKISIYIYFIIILSSLFSCMPYYELEIDKHWEARKGQAKQIDKCNAEKDSLRQIIEIIAVDPNYLDEIQKEILDKDFISSEYDEFYKKTVYKSTRKTHTGNLYGKGINIYFYINSYDDGRKSLYLLTKYMDESWIFYDQFRLLGDNGTQIVIKTKHPEKQTDNDILGIKEWSYNKIDFNQAKELNKAHKIKYRFSGKYTVDGELNWDQRQAFREIITLYQNL